MFWEHWGDEETQDPHPWRQSMEPQSQASCPCPLESLNLSFLNYKWGWCLAQPGHCHWNEIMVGKAHGE